MNTDPIVHIAQQLCDGRRVRIPALTRLQLTYLLNHVAANREEIHGANKPTIH